MSKSLVATSLAWMALLGCNDFSRQEPRAPTPDNLFTEHRPLRAERPTGRLGDDCTTHGASGCLSGICLHILPGPRSGYTCSQRCNSSSDCPAHWTCGSIHPTSTRLLCIPPVAPAAETSSP